jgi:hypothetical protein
MNELALETFERDQKLAHDEWVAWRNVCQLLMRAGLDVNTTSQGNQLTKAIEYWGERLVTLRVTQTEELRKRVLDDKRAKWMKVRDEK